MDLDLSSLDPFHIQIEYGHFFACWFFTTAFITRSRYSFTSSSVRHEDDETGSGYPIHKSSTAK